MLKSEADFDLSNSARLQERSRLKNNWFSGLVSMIQSLIPVDESLLSVLGLSNTPKLLQMASFGQKGNPLIFFLTFSFKMMEKLREFPYQILSGLRESAETEKLFACTASLKMTSIHGNKNTQKIAHLARPLQIVVTGHFCVSSSIVSVNAWCY